MKTCICKIVLALVTFSGFVHATEIVGTWGSPCELIQMGPVTNSTRSHFEFLPDGTLIARWTDWLNEDCTEHQQKPRSIAGTYTLGSNGAIDINYGQPGGTYFQIFTIRDGHLFFGNVWAQGNTPRPMTINFSKPWEPASPPVY